MHVARGSGGARSCGTTDSNYVGSTTLDQLLPLNNDNLSQFLLHYSLAGRYIVLPSPID